MDFVLCVTLHAYPASEVNANVLVVITTLVTCATDAVQCAPPVQVKLYALVVLVNINFLDTRAVLFHAWPAIPMDAVDALMDTFWYQRNALHAILLVELV
jgi:hypothetical protein